ncbi:hypothetical protein J1N35_016839 [Gossypium stocksii]|uniref:Uncharacterized protein n=1 Tax=Gossypium stocksii TaxID=47602 RepID=A0A9D3VM22_9ROSI|nr:hypothetical protein J1N35_016839 [Gossypium stocksii]
MLLGCRLDLKFMAVIALLAADYLFHIVAAVAVSLLQLFSGARCFNLFQTYRPNYHQWRLYRFTIIAAPKIASICCLFAPIFASRFLPIIQSNGYYLLAFFSFIKFFKYHSNNKFRVLRILFHQILDIFFFA